jgi:hypothetical protein
MVNLDNIIYNFSNAKGIPKLSCRRIGEEKVQNIFRTLIAYRTASCIANMMIRKITFQWNNAMESSPCEIFDFAWDFHSPNYFPYRV